MKEMINRIYDKNHVNIINMSGGKDSTALLLKAIELGVEFEAIFCDTGHEHSLTYEYIDYLEERLSIKIRRVKADFSKKIATRKENMQKRWEEQGIAQERIDEAAELLKPTGNPMFDACLAHGRFPNAIGKFCTAELKIKPVIEQVYEPIWASGKEVISWQGVRRAESKRRSTALEYEEMPEGYDVYRPLVDWSARDVFDMHDKHGVEPNPLYKLGMGRVGCMPCIHANKGEVYEIARRFPEMINKIRDWEEKISKVSTRGRATFFENSIDEHVEWSMTSRGGKQLDAEKLIGMEDVPICSSQYGLCE